MKKQVGIWLDTDKAILIELDNSDEDMTTIASNVETRARYAGETKPHGKRASLLANPVSKHTHRQKQQMHQYFTNIMDQIETASDIYLFGPARTKIAFEKELKRHPTMANKHIEVESMGKLTPNQMLAMVRNHFEHHHA